MLSWRATPSSSAASGSPGGGRTRPAMSGIGNAATSLTWP